MNNTTEKIPGRSLIVCGAIAVAIFTAALAHAQRVALEPEVATGPAATKTVTFINRPGSYVLARNLAVSKAGVDGVLITSSNVTLNLQGYVIIGTSGTANGIEVAASLNDVVIVDGIITGFGGAGILAASDTGTNISAVTVQGNGTGISCGIGSLVQSSIIQGNTGEGLTFSDFTGGYLGNVLQGNDSNTSPGATGQVTRGTSLGNNVCNGVAC